MSETKCPNCKGTGFFEHCTECGGGPGCVYCNLESGDSMVAGKDCVMCKGTGSIEKSQKQEMQAECSCRRDLNEDDGTCTMCGIHPGECTCVNLDKSQKQEMQDAQKEGRIPICASCNHEICSIVVVQHEYIDWTYEESSKQYVRGEYDNGDSDKPRHDCKVQGCVCDHQTWDLLDENSEVGLGVIF